MCVLVGEVEVTLLYCSSVHHLFPWLTFPCFHGIEYNKSDLNNQHKAKMMITMCNMHIILAKSSGLMFEGIVIL